MKDPRRRLTRPIMRAIEEFGNRAKERLSWEWYTKGSRTGMSGYALYIETGFHENGRRMNRRLWVHPHMRNALLVAETIREQIGASDQLNQLRRLIDAREIEQNEYRERWS